MQLGVLARLRLEQDQFQQFVIGEGTGPGVQEAGAQALAMAEVIRLVGLPVPGFSHRR